MTGIAILRDPGSPENRAVGFDDTSQGSLKVHHSWKFASDRGDELDGTTTVSALNGRPFVKATSALAVFPPSLSGVKFAEKTKDEQQLRATSPGTAAGPSTTVVQLQVARGEAPQAFHYTVKVPTRGNKLDRFDRWQDEMLAAASTLCTTVRAPKLCGIADHLIEVSFSIPAAPPIGPLQTFDASTTLQGKNKSGSLVAPGHVDGATFTSSDPSKTTVNEKTGVVTGVAAGPASITATVGDLSTGALLIDVKATPFPEVTKLTIDGPADLTWAQRYVVHGFSDAGAEQLVVANWTITPVRAGLIDSAGLFTPITSDESVKITAETVNVEGKRITASKSVQVTKVDPDPDNDGVKGTDDQCPTLPGRGSPTGCPVDPCSANSITDDGCPPPPCPMNPAAGPDGSCGDRCPTVAAPGTPDGCPPPPGKPDLVVTGFSVQSTATTGECIVFMVTIKNQGPGATPDGVKHGVLFVVDGGLHLWTDQFRSAMPAGTSVTLTANGGHGDTTCPNSGADPFAPFWRATSGRHSVKAWVDDTNRENPNGSIDESNESNNDDWPLQYIQVG